MDLVDLHMQDIYKELAADISQRSAAAASRPFIVAIAGPPGVGKSTTSRKLQSMLLDSAIVPMDGFHYYRSQLEQFANKDQAFARRGAHWTFDAAKFVDKLRVLRENNSYDAIKFPSFDHAIGDPIEDDIEVSARCKVIIIEGNYLCLSDEPWCQVLDNHLVDYSIYITASMEVLRERIIQRHQSVGMSLEEAISRADNNDLINAALIETCKARADRIVVSL